MTDEFEKALHRALRSRANPGEDFAARVATRLDSSDSSDWSDSSGSSHSGDSSRMGSTVAARPSHVRHGAFRSRWFPVALAACLIAAIGFVQMRQHAVDAARANQARAQLLQALSIASDNVNIVRATVAREEHPDS